METEGWFGRGNAGSSLAGTAAESTLLCEFLSALRDQLAAVRLVSVAWRRLLGKSQRGANLFSVIGRDETFELFDQARHRLPGRSRLHSLWRLLNLLILKPPRCLRQSRHSHPRRATQNPIASYSKPSLSDVAQDLDNTPSHAARSRE